MRKYKIPVSWTMSGIVEVKANSAEEALKTLKQNAKYVQIPVQQHYVDESFHVDCDNPEDLVFSK